MLLHFYLSVRICSKFQRELVYFSYLPAAYNGTTDVPL